MQSPVPIGTLPKGARIRSIRGLTRGIVRGTRAGLVLVTYTHWRVARSSPWLRIAVRSQLRPDIPVVPIRDRKSPEAPCTHSSNS